MSNTTAEGYVDDSKAMKRKIEGIVRTNLRTNLRRKHSDPSATVSKSVRSAIDIRPSTSDNYCGAVTNNDSIIM